MKTLIMLIGPSGCGKSTLERQIVTLGNAHKVVSVTTRPPRKGEVDGVDYHFISEQEFTALKMQDALIQTTSFGGYNYGSSRDEYTTPNEIATLCVIPLPAAELKQRLSDEYPNMQIVVVYFNITPERLVANMTSRGDSERDIRTRIAQDDIVTKMVESGLRPNINITDDMLTTNLGEAVMSRIHTGTYNGT